MSDAVAGPSGLSVQGFYTRNRRRHNITVESAIDDIFSNSYQGSDLEVDENFSIEGEEDTVVTTEIQASNVTETQRGRGRGRGRGGVRGPRQPRRTIHKFNIQDDLILGWKNATENDVLPNKPNFSANPGIRHPGITPESRPYDIFSIFWGDYFEQVKSETNKYARFQIDKEIRKNGQLKPKTVMGRWKAVTIRDLKLFFAIIIHMSLVVKPTLKLYWSTKTIYSSRFCKIVGMSRDRFLDILTMLHLTDNRNQKPADHPEYDPLFKIRPFHDRILELFKSIYSPKQDLTIDEGMCPFRGRLSFKVYIKGKPHKYGIKLNMLCEASSGYCSNFEIYTGAMLQLPEDYNSVRNVIFRLMGPYLNKGYIVYMDRLFSGPILFNELWDNKTMAVGTVMKSRREMPKYAFEENLAVGQVLFQRRNHLLAIKFHDKRDVFMLSTIHKAQMVPCLSVNRTVEKLKPSAVVDYNKNKVGVDRSDQLLSYNSFRRKTIKWWKKLFLHLFDLTMTNCKIIYDKCNPTQCMTLLQFYEAIAFALFEDSGMEEPQLELPLNKDSEMLRLNGKGHIIVPIPATTCKTKPYRRCKCCNEKQKHQPGLKRVESRYMCETCGVALCISPCFKDFHSKKIFWQ